ncbi:MAG: cadmium-translocating P-type ATPase, partial [Nitrospiraceae bacterium]|nr:cadmium-translocating P-type ATPase [Nitrospiraceae bacterium]
EIAVLKKEVGGKNGVLALDFDVLNARMTVTHDPEKIGPDAIIAATGTAGMRAIPWEERTKQEAESFWQQRGRPIMTAASGALLAAGFCTHWFLHGNILDALAIGDGGDDHVFPLASILLYMASIVCGAWFVVPKAVGAAKRFRPDMNFLMVVAVIGATAIGEWLEATTVTLLFAVALLLEHWSVGRARRAIGALMDLSPTMARYVSPDNTDILEKCVEEVPIGVTVLVRPGEKIPLDGEVTKGTSTVNQAPITGESLPVPKEPGDEVFAGTINEDGALEFKVTKSANDTTLARIIHLVQEAQSRRAPSEQWVETFARYYTPAMMALAAAIIVVPPLFFSAPWAEWFYRGLVLLVIACPCALVISTPVSIVSGLTTAARNGVLIKGGTYLEAVGRLRALALDKTGTLTYGRPEVQQVIPFSQHTPKELLERAAALEAHSEHPLARAILRRAEAEGISARPAEGFQAIKGKGADAEIDGTPFWIGSHRLMEEKGQETPEVHDKAEELEDAGHSVVAVGNDQHVCGIISVADGVRENAGETVQAIKRLGIGKVVMLTGDNGGTARAVAAVTNVDEFRAELLPEDKVEAVESLVNEFGQVAMIGDGVNDAPAMAVASFGIAMGAMGTDAAIETADIALMSDDLSKLPWLIWHSRRTLRTIKQNIIFALGLKLVFIVLTLFGAASLWMAIAADTGASLLVIFNSLRLLGGRARVDKSTRAKNT